MRVLYLGDTTITTAASYLAGIMTHGGIEFDYYPSGAQATSIVSKRYDVYILSDYAADDLEPEYSDVISDAVSGGAGLLMIGGWESFHGAGGNWDKNPLAQLLPVEISAEDDRVNWSGPCVVRKIMNHPILGSLDFSPAPVIGGYNRVVLKGEATGVLAVHRYNVTPSDSRSDPTFAPAGEDPLLVVGTAGSGRTAAFTSDVAPHWVGGLVDWGNERVRVATNDFEIEVGSAYTELFIGILGWLGSNSSRLRH